MAPSRLTIRAPVRSTSGQNPVTENFGARLADPPICMVESTVAMA